MTWSVRHKNSSFVQLLSENQQCENLNFTIITCDDEILFDDAVITAGQCAWQHIFWYFNKY